MVLQTQVLAPVFGPCLELCGVHGLPVVDILGWIFEASKLRSRALMLARIDADVVVVGFMTRVMTMMMMMMRTAAMLIIII